jgi:outer membrane protein
VVPINSYTFSCAARGTRLLARRALHMCYRSGFLHSIRFLAIAPILIMVCNRDAAAQRAPISPTKPWLGMAGRPSADLKKYAGNEFALSSEKTYTLPELIDLAEEHNPETRAAWESAKAAAGALGVARSDLYPTLAATAMGQTYQTGVLIYDTFVKQIVGLAEENLALTYTVFDFGARLDRVARERSNLLSANFSFNDAHRRIIYQVMTSFYQLLNANGQRRAAEANLVNAKAVQQAAEARLQNGLATLPDVLETQSATAQAEYDLQQTIGATEIASGDLATSLTASPSSAFHVEDIDAFHVPDQLSEPVNDLIKRALAQRPDLLARVEEISGYTTSTFGILSQLSVSGNVRLSSGIWRATSLCGSLCRCSGLQCAAYPFLDDFRRG